MARLPKPEPYVGPRRRETRRIPVGVLVALGALALLAAALYAFAEPAGASSPRCQPGPSAAATAAPAGGALGATAGKRLLNCQRSNA